MSFTTLALTGTIQNSPGTAIPNAVVTLECSSQISDGTTDITPAPIVASTNSSGEFTVSDVPANDDSTTTPTGTFYYVTITKSGEIVDSFKVSVPAADAPSVGLFSLPRIS